MDQNGSVGGGGSARVAAVTGATGFVGGYVVRAFLDRGWRVRALARTPEKAAPLAELDGVDVVYGDVRDEGVLVELARGASAFAHLVGIIRETRGQRFQALHVEATRRVLSACRAAGVGRYLHMSALGVDDEGRCPYQRTKFEAEMSVRESGLAWTIFRPSLIHGRGGELTHQIASWSRGSIPPYIGLPYFRRPEVEQSVPLGGSDYKDPLVQPVYVGDVAAYFAEAPDRPQTIGEVFNLVGPEVLSWPELLRFAHERVPGAKAGLKPMWVPAEYAAFGATVASLIGLGQLLPFDAGMATMGAEDSVADPERTEAYFDTRARAFTEAFGTYAASL